MKHYLLASLLCLFCCVKQPIVEAPHDMVIPPLEKPALEKTSKHKSAHWQIKVESEWQGLKTWDFDNNDLPAKGMALLINERGFGCFVQRFPADYLDDQLVNEESIIVLCTVPEKDVPISTHDVVCENGKYVTAKKDDIYIEITCRLDD